MTIHMWPIKQITLQDTTRQNQSYGKGDIKDKDNQGTKIVDHASEQ